MRGWRFIKVLLAGLLLVGTVSSPPALAQQSNTARLGITVSPVIDEFEIKPGETKIRQVKVTNPVQQVVTLYPKVLNFTTDNENGQPSFYNLNEKNTRYALSDWISFTKNGQPLNFIRVAPNENEVVDVTIKAPDDAEPGGHYGAVLFSTEPPKVNEDVSQVSVVGLIGSLMLATVPGDLHQNTIIEEFDAPTVLIDGPANFSLLFNNTGNIHSKPQGEIKIRNWSGALVSALKVNEGGGNILPESKRRFNSTWTFDWKRLGKYTATAVASYGNPEQELTSVRTFIIIPIWLMVAVGVLILLLIGWLLRRRGRNKPQVKTVIPDLPPDPKQPRRIIMR